MELRDKTCENQCSIALTNPEIKRLWYQKLNYHTMCNKHERPTLHNVIALLELLACDLKVYAIYCTKF